MRRETENTLLLLVGISIAMITVTGAFTRYVKPGLLPWLAASAALLIVLALAAIIGDIRRGRPREHGDHAEGHSHRTGMVWLLLVPILVLIFVTPPALRPSAASVTTVSNDVLKQAFPPLPPGRAPELSLPEVLMREAQDTSGALTNRTHHRDRLCPQRGPGGGPRPHRHHLLRRRRPTGPNPSARSGGSTGRRAARQHLASGRRVR